MREETEDTRNLAKIEEKLEGQVFFQRMFGRNIGRFPENMFPGFTAEKRVEAQIIRY